jgi:AraC-like DNA-binding protein
MELATTIFNLTMIAGIFLGIFFIIFTQFSNRRKDKAVIYLNLIVLFITLNNLQIYLIDNSILEVNFFVRKLLIPWYVMILPSFYAFVIYYLKIEKQINHYIGFAITFFGLELLIRVLFALFFYGFNYNYAVAKYSQVEEIINVIYAFYFFVKAYLVFYKHSKLYAFVLKFDTIQWLKNFMFLGSLVLLLWVSAVILNLDKVLNPTIFIYYPMRFSCSVVLYWIGYQGFFNYEMLTERIELRRLVAKTDSEITPQNKEIKETGSIDKFLGIKEYIESNKRYLDPNFSLEMLSSELKISTSSLSQTINKDNSTNFSDYINNLRVEKAKKYLTKSEYKKYTILSIGLECGFNSKSTFYAAFKKFTNTTPSDYRLNNQ